jgi:hypothetical protein
MRCLYFFLVFFPNIIFAQNWNEIQKIVAPDRATSDHFSKSISISNNYAVIGAHRTQTDENGNNPVLKAGGVYVFKKDNTGQWNFVQKLVANDRMAEDNFGTSVSIKNNYIIVGAYKRDTTISGTFYSQIGACYIFKKDSNNNWNQTQKLIAPDLDSLDYFGKSVSITDNYLIIGAAFKNSGSLSQAGAAYIYEKDSSGYWNFSQKLTASDIDGFSVFGWSVSIKDNRAVVGAYKDDKNENGNQVMLDAGAAYIFERDNFGNWNEIKKLVASDRNSNDFFGYATALSDSTIIIGAYQEGEDVNGQNTLQNSGSAYIFKLNNTGQWNETQKITAPNRFTDDRFGYSVGISGNNIIVGAYKEDEDLNESSTLTDAGAAYIYTLNTNAWVFSEKLTVTDRSTNDWLGFSVAIENENILIGAFGDKEDENGQNILNDAGSVYFFKNPSILTLDNFTSIDFKIYPNPTLDKIYFSGISPYSTIKIYNYSGQLIQQISNVNEVDMTSFSKGVYLIQILSDSKIFTQKVIKN